METLNDFIVYWSDCPLCHGPLILSAVDPKFQALDINLTQDTIILTRKRTSYQMSFRNQTQIVEYHLSRTTNQFYLHFPDQTDISLTSLDACLGTTPAFIRLKHKCTDCQKAYYLSEQLILCYDGSTSTPALQSETYQLTYTAPSGSSQVYQLTNQPTIQTTDIIHLDSNFEISLPLCPLQSFLDHPQRLPTFLLFAD